MKKKIIDKISLKVLYLEDSPRDVEIIRELLIDAGYDLSMDCAEKKKEFTSLLHSNTYDVILSDFKLPGFDAHGALKLTKDIYPEVPFICVSGSIGEETAIELIKQGAVDYILKDRLVRLPLAIRRSLDESKEKKSRQQAEEALHESEEKFRKIFKDHAAVKLLIDSESGEIIDANNSAAVYYGWNCEELKRMKINQINILTPEEVKMEMQKVISQKRVQFEFKHRRKDGSIRDVEVFSSNISIGNKNVLHSIVHDITERKQAEKQVALITHTLKSVAECVSVTDLNDRVLFVNNAFLKTYGYSEHEILGKNIDVVRSPNNPPETTRGILAATLAGGWSGELMNRTKDGRDFPVSLSTSFVRDEQGQDIALVGIATDISERKLAEDKLQESEERYKALFERSLDLVYVFDFEGNFIDANDAALNLLGYKKEEIGSLNFASLLSEDQLPLAFKVTQEIKETGIQKNLVEFKLRCRDGEEVYVESKGSAIISNGITVAVQSIARNITERKHTEEKLSKSEEKYRSIFENVQDVYYETLLDGTILEVSPSIEFISKGQYHRTDLIGKSMFEFYPDAKDRDTILAAMQKTGSVTDLEVQLKNRDGSFIPCSISAKMSFNAEGRPEKIIGSMHDITERKRAEEEIQQSEIKFRNLFNNAEVGMFRTRLDGSEIIEFNEKYLKILHYTREEITGKPSVNMWADKREREKMVQILNAEGRVTDFEFDLLTKQGEVRRCIASLRSYRDMGILEGSIYDITERKRAEKELQWKTAFLEAQVNSSIDGVLVVDSQGKKILQNQKCIDLWKIPQNIVEQNEDAAQVQYVMNRAKYPEQFVEKVTHLYTHPHEISHDEIEFKDGMFLDRYSAPVLGQDGTNYGRIWTFRDITERKHAEDSLQESELRFRSLYENSTIGLYRTTPDGKIILANPTLVEILGYSSFEELAARNLEEEGFEPSYKRKHFIEKIELNGEVKSLESAWNRQDGSTVYVRESAQAIRDPDGKTLYYDGTVEDITERKRAEEELIKNETLLRTAVENLPMIFYMIDLNGIFNLSIGAGLKGLGLAPNQVVGQSAFDIYKDHPEIITSIKKSIAGENTYFESNVSGSTYINFVVPYSLDKRKLTGLIGVALDITDRKQLEEQMRQMQKLEGLGTLAGGIAHDFNNILGIILGYNTSIKRFKDDPKKLDLAVETITKAVQRGKTLVQSILTFARKTETTFGAVNVNDVVIEIMTMILETFPKTLTYSQNFDKAIPYINADRSQLHQALLNLCVNARDAMPKGGVLTINTRMVSVVSLRNRHPDAAGSSYVCIEVSDTGEGMSEEIQKRIFEPFFTTKGIGKGTGLGLAVVFGVIQSHKGFIDVESDLGNLPAGKAGGTTFRLYLPASQVAEPISEKEEETLESIPGGTETLLVVEDEEMLLIPLQITLVEKGYKVLSAKDGVEALKIYQEKKNDIALVLTDLGLPNISGLEVCNKIKKINPNQHVILASGYIDPNMKSELLKTRIQHFLYKPYDFKIVLNMVRGVLDEK